MTPTRPAHTIDALYAIGHTVVSFQRLEHILKKLALFAPICATPSSLQSAVDKRRASVDRMTLGQGVRKWIESEFHINEPKQARRLDEEVFVSFGFDLPRPPEFFDQLSSELESVAQERNSLIHLDLAELNFEDEAECTALIIRLDVQNERIIRATKILGPILAKMQEFAQLISSDPRIIQELLNPTLVKEDEE